MHRPLILTLALLGTPALAGPEALIQATELQQHLATASPKLLLLDASPTPRFQKAHIPGAVSADFYAYGMNPGGREQMQQRLRRWGVSQDPAQRIVIYDAGADNTATRIYFDLLAHGIPASRLQVLDGGLHQWKAQGGAVQAGTGRQPEPGNVEAKEADPRLGSNLAEFVSLSGKPGEGRLIEALEPQYYFAGQKMFERGGHVPNALMLPWEEMFNADKTFKKPEEIARRLALLGVRADQPAISYCGGGVAAAVPFFAMRALLDWPQAKLYVGSQREYLMDERQLPMWTYAEATPMRDRPWLAGWNNAMLRMFDATHVTVLDLRAPEAFAKERLPNSINLPAPLWQAHRRDPAQLTKLLAAAGASPQRELVLVSNGNGLSPDKALALLMLRELGQARVSVLRDSVDEWALAGGEMEKGEPKPRAASSAGWPAAGKPPVATAALADAPKQWLDVGATAGATTGAERAVHLPVAQLLEANGDPKPAFQLWQALNKAGVDRYAEVHIRATDPADAATAHALLRLAGYPRLRVMDR